MVAKVKPSINSYLKKHNYYLKNTQTKTPHKSARKSDRAFPGPLSQG